MKPTGTAAQRPDAIIVALLAIALLAATVLTDSSPAAPPTGSADLSITKTDAKDPVNAGESIDYTIAVTNAGPDTAVNTVVIDTLPKGSTFVSATATIGTCAAKGAKVTCNLGDLTNGGASGAASITLRVTAPTKAGTITNKADVASDTPDPNQANNSASQNTTVSGGAPSCLGSTATIVGTTAAETLRGTEGRDVIAASGGDDVILGLGGKDLICGASGADRIKGGDADDRLSGAGGSDRIGGQEGNDLVKGGGRADTLRGGVGNDRLSGGAGNDRCSGGAGKDTERSC